MVRLNAADIRAFSRLSLCNCLAVDESSDGRCAVPFLPDVTLKVVEILRAIVASGGEATGSHLVETCDLRGPQLTRQLAWMERHGLVNQVQSHDGRTWVRATVDGRAALDRASDA